MTRLSRPLGYAVALLLLVGLVTVGLRSGDSDTMTVTVTFRRTVGLYPGSSVRILGVKIGTVKRIQPQGDTVRVTMELPADTAVPADAQAVIIPPSLVSDRYVQLVPVYRQGARMGDGDAIPLARTREPIELDEILASLDRLLVALGPGGANGDGSLGELVKVGAKTLDGQGAQLKKTLTDLAAAMNTLAGGREDLAGVLTNLTAFTHTLAVNDTKVRVLTKDLGSVATQLAGEREALEQALANLAVALGEIASLVRDNKANLIRDVDTLAKVTKTVLDNKRSLVEALDTTPLVLANITETINTDRGTLDIRNNNGQGEDPYGIFICQLLAPILGIPLPDCDPPGAAKPAAPRGRPLPAGALDRLGVGGMLGGPQ